MDTQLLSSLTQLGAGGALVVILLWMILKFLENKKNGTEQILCRLEAIDGKMASAMESVATAINNQTRLVEKMSDRQEIMHDEIKEINHGAVSRQVS